MLQPQGHANYINSVDALVDAYGHIDLLTSDSKDTGGGSSSSAAANENKYVNCWDLLLAAALDQDSRDVALRVVRHVHQRVLSLPAGHNNNDNNPTLDVQSLAEMARRGWLTSPGMVTGAMASVKTQADVTVAVQLAVKLYPVDARQAVGIMVARPDMVVAMITVLTKESTLGRENLGDIALSRALLQALIKDRSRVSLATWSDAVLRAQNAPGLFGILMADLGAADATALAAAVTKGLIQHIHPAATIPTDPVALGNLIQLIKMLTRQLCVVPYSSALAAPSQEHGFLMILMQRVLVQLAFDDARARDIWSAMTVISAYMFKHFPNITKKA
jgi:hypothetical protein